MQDNGTQMRIGEGVWRLVVRNGDSGGVAFDPGAPGRFMAQTFQTIWTEDGGVDVSPTFRLSFAAGSANLAERGQSTFYSYAAVTRTVGAGAVTRLAVGSDRVWFTERWGLSHWDGAVWRRGVGHPAHPHRPAGRGRRAAGESGRAHPGPAAERPGPVADRRRWCPAVSGCCAG